MAVRSALMRTPPPLPRQFGWAAAALLAVFCGIGYLRCVDTRPLLAAVLAVVAYGAALVAVFGPRWLLLPAAFVSSAAITALADGEASNVAWFVVALLAGWCVLTGARWMALLFWAAAVTLFAVEAAVSRPDPGWAAWIAGTCFSVVGCYLGHRQHELLVELRAAQAGLAKQARTEERNRIARELHDVIAHSMTVSLLHIGSARLALADDPADAARALADAERLSRASLDEVRHSVGLLREAGDPSAPLPGSLDVAALIAGFRSAGADVEAEVSGDVALLPATVGLATYRILQEALTNAAKHAPGAGVAVHLAIDARLVRLQVDSSGRPGAGHGLGLGGMHERAESVGGRLRAGPGGSGWLVSAEMPVDTDQMSARP